MFSLFYSHSYFYLHPKQKLIVAILVWNLIMQMKIMHFVREYKRKLMKEWKN